MKQSELAARNRRIVDMYVLEGCSQTRIGAQFGITSQAVQWVLKNAGFTRADRGRGTRTPKLEMPSPGE